MVPILLALSCPDLRTSTGALPARFQSDKAKFNTRLEDSSGVVRAVLRDVGDAKVGNPVSHYEEE